MKEYLKLPLRFAPVFSGNKLPVCNMLDSIYRNLHLIITTAMDENKADEQYGVAFWDNDYDIHLSNDVRKEIIISNLKQQIAQYETRITDVNLTVNVKQALLKTPTGDGLRRRIEIIIAGKIKRSAEPFTFQTGFFIGPFLL